MSFDPLAHLPANLFPTTERVEALVNFFVINFRAPTPAEVEDLMGPGIDHGDRTDSLPDGFAGRDWRNPDWLRRLVARGPREDHPVTVPTFAPFADGTGFVLSGVVSHFI